MGVPCMRTADRLATLVEQIKALDRRREDRLCDTFLDPWVKSRMAYLHAVWRDLLIENIAEMKRMTMLSQRWLELEAENIVHMERVEALLRSLERDVPNEGA